MINKPKVSAIITTHNRAGFLRGAIESVLKQTYMNIECIVVDDASTDETPKICSKYPIQYIRIPEGESRGGNYARNIGIKASIGDYCAFLDDDDAWLPEKIEKQINLVKEKKCSLVFCRRIFERIVDGKVVGNSYEDNYKPIGNLQEIIFRHYITNTSCILAAKKHLLEVGCFDVELKKWQEYDLMIRMSEITDIYYVDDYLCLYRVDKSDNNRVSNDFDRVINTIHKIKKKYARRIAKLSLKTKIYFIGMCVSEIYRLALRNKRYIYYLSLFIPYIIFNIFKIIDNPSLIKSKLFKEVL